MNNSSARPVHIVEWLNVGDRDTGREFVDEMSR
jgi:hypothetical protein